VYVLQSVILDINRNIALLDYLAHFKPSRLPTHQFGRGVEWECFFQFQPEEFRINYTTLNSRGIGVPCIEITTVNTPDFLTPFIISLLASMRLEIEELSGYVVSFWHDKGPFEVNISSFA